MIRCTCITDLSLEHDEIWPKELDALPPIGTLIESGKLRNHGERLILQVASINYKFDENLWPGNTTRPKFGWYAEIQLKIPDYFLGPKEFDLFYKLLLGQITWEQYRNIHDELFNVSTGGDI